MRSDLTIKFFFVAASVLWIYPSFAQSAKVAPAQEAQTQMGQAGEEEAITLAIDGLNRQLAALWLKKTRVLAEKNSLDEEISEIASGISEAQNKLEELRPLLKKHALSWRITLLRNPLAAPYAAPHDYHRYKWLMKRIAQQDAEMLKANRELTGGLRTQKAELSAKSGRVREIIEELETQEEELSALKAEQQKELERLKAIAEKLEGARDKLAKASGEKIQKLKGKINSPVKGGAKYVCERETGPNCLGVRFQDSGGKEAIAAAEGDVVYSGWFRGYGNVVILNHGGGYHALYAGLEKIITQIGSSVNKGDSVGIIESKGLYFELRKEGEPDKILQWLSD